VTLLDVRNLSINYEINGRALPAVIDLSFQLEQGRTLALVGESGCGKTTTMLALLRLLPAEGRIVGGEIRYRDVDLLRLDEAGIRQYRWGKIAIVFQSAMNALNPVRTIGDQIAEAITLHENLGKRAARQRVGDLLAMVGISPDRAHQYPHQFSGGMKQRALIAMALACQPDILIADEPTTALDVMVQAQILDLLGRLRDELNLTVILVTHDLGVVAEFCDEVLVMYAGKVAEYASADAIFNTPLHPYTQRLLAAFPDIDQTDTPPGSIPGSAPMLHALPPGCRFEPRCHRRTDLCATTDPDLRLLAPDQWAACHHADAADHQPR
jgi:oligopeptide/dipeptide ABC transporter ATP-binding protein